MTTLKEDGLTLSHFIAASSTQETSKTNPQLLGTYNLSVHPADLGDEFYDEQDIVVTDSMSSSKRNQSLDRLSQQIINANEDSHDERHTLKFHIKTYGCQMNVNDTDIVVS
jgi:hypothetical protein